ncbi:ATP-binding cassette domain-containing protein [Oceanithermus sp.]|uniref:ATP-binding cassette domain-containing protein n=1 Tax=Oceanithermus sp. TaxID=2268145 RepID=UPI00257FBC45|nr:ATP-binding cassette domain-containing protein [Oceanithermus sp.]
MDAGLVLQVERLSRTYRSGRGVHAVSFRVAYGEIVTLVGPNGAGKTTLLEAVCGLADYVGSVRVEGFDREQASAQWARMACLPEERRFPSFLAGLTAARLAERFWEQPGLGDRFVSEAERWELGAAELETPTFALSQGMREKLALALVFSRVVPLYVLDEPEAHLNPVIRDRLERRLAGLREGGHAVLLATHDVHLAARLADRVLVIVRGRVTDLGRAGVDEVLRALHAGT